MRCFDPADPPTEPCMGRAGWGQGRWLTAQGAAVLEPDWTRWSDYSSNQHHPHDEHPPWVSVCIPSSDRSWLRYESEMEGSIRACLRERRASPWTVPPRDSSTREWHHLNAPVCPRYDSAASAEVVHSSGMKLPDRSSTKQPYWQLWARGAIPLEWMGWMRNCCWCDRGNRSKPKPFLTRHPSVSCCPLHWTIDWASRCRFRWWWPSRRRRCSDSSRRCDGNWTWEEDWG